jgi:molybdopterin-containing oxidoreductase family membrane subunit
MWLSEVSDDLLGWMRFVADCYAAYAALLLLLISLVGSIPIRSCDGFRTASRIMAMILAGSGVVLLGQYLLDYGIVVLRGDRIEQWLFMERAFGPIVWLGTAVLGVKMLVPQLLWIPWFRRQTFASALISAFALAGHAVTYAVFRIANSSRDELPSSWGDLLSLLFAV